jgi:hypothetical protein
VGLLKNANTHGKEAWVMQNSWGPHWGVTRAGEPYSASNANAGYAMLAYGQDTCAIDLDATWASDVFSGANGKHPWTKQTPVYKWVELENGYTQLPPKTTKQFFKIAMEKRGFGQPKSLEGAYESVQHCEIDCEIRFPTADPTLTLANGDKEQTPTLTIIWMQRSKYCMCFYYDVPDFMYAYGDTSPDGEDFTMYQIAGGDGARTVLHDGAPYYGSIGTYLDLAQAQPTTSWSWMAMVSGFIGGIVFVSGAVAVIKSHKQNQAQEPLLQS